MKIILTNELIRTEPRRRSLASSLTQMFKKSTNSLELQSVPNELGENIDSFSSISEEESKDKDAAISKTRYLHAASII